MQAIIMAAGKGSRLGNVTNDLPKSFIEINGKKLIDYNLDMLTKYDIKEIIIVTGYKTDFFEKALVNRKNVKIVFNPFYDTTNVLTSFWFGQEYLKEDFIYMHADTLCDTEVFEDLLRKTGDIVLPVDYKECDAEAMKVQVANDKVIQINKTMDINSANGEFIGIAKISKECIPSLKKITTRILKEKRFSSFFEVALQEIIDIDHFKIETIPTNNRFWCEIDFEDDYIRAKNEISMSLLKL